MIISYEGEGGVGGWDICGSEGGGDYGKGGWSDGGGGDYGMGGCYSRSLHNVAVGRHLSVVENRCTLDSGRGSFCVDWIRCALCRRRRKRGS